MKLFEQVNPTSHAKHDSAWTEARKIGTHTLIRMDERSPLTKTRLMSSGFTPVLFIHDEPFLDPAEAFDWTHPPQAKVRPLAPEMKYMSLEFQQACLTKHYSPRTEESYTQWIERLLRFH